MKLDYVIWCGYLLLCHCGIEVHGDAGDVARGETAVRVDAFVDGTTVDHDVLEDGSLTTDANLCDGALCVREDVPYAASIGRSCTGANGAPAEHCREVAHGGGPFTMGSLDAFKQTPGRPNPWNPQTECDVRQGIVHSGFIDAYPVSVARYRAFVRAGTPAPPVGARVFDQLVWTREGNPFVRNVEFNRNLGCTYTAEPSDADVLPMNCIDVIRAIAFCYWDGKHPVTEPAWEYVATNSGTTARPFNAPLGFNPCEYGDVGNAPGEICGRVQVGEQAFPLPIASFPNSATRNPVGVFGMWGGLAVDVLGARRVQCDGAFVDGFPMLVLGERERITRNVTLSDHHLSLDAMQWSRSYASARPAPVLGIRCARWDPEPRD